MLFKFALPILCLTLCISCIKPLGDRVVAPEEIMPYVEKFIEEGEARGHSIRTIKVRIQFVDDLDEGEAGHCKVVGVGIVLVAARVYKKIKIDRESFEAASAIQKEIVIFHELGHCALNRAHDDDLLDSGAPKSMMTSGGSIYGYYQTNREYYLDELFE
jgi:hypothetical protein